VDRVIYTNTGRQTVAVDARTCQLRWRHECVPEDKELRQSSRGPAVLDGRLLALDAATVKVLWSNAISYSIAALKEWLGLTLAIRKTDNNNSAAPIDRARGEGTLAQVRGNQEANT
jgi:outer membrane protein assembly factor BamB